MKLPLLFPGSEACFNSVSQATDAQLLAKSMLWAATTSACANEAFNIVNGDFFRWRYLWPKIAAYFDIEAGPVQTVDLSERMNGMDGLWDDIVKAHSLKPTRFADLGNWGYFDFTLRFDSDDISQSIKARRYGFNDFADTEQALMKAFDRLRAMRIIP